MRIFLGVLLLLLVAISPAHAAIKFLAHVTFHTPLQTPGTVSVSILVTELATGIVETIGRDVDASLLTSPVGVETAIRNRVVARAADRGVTIVPAEVGIIGGIR